MYAFNLKYRFQGHFDDTLSSNKANGLCFFPTLQKGELFYVVTNARAQLSTFITTEVFHDSKLGRFRCRVIENTFCRV